jgi:hypothetical protein
MKPINFKQANTVYAVNQPPYLPMPAERDCGGIVTSCWRLGFIERLTLLVRGRIYVQLATSDGRPQPQRLSVGSKR